MRPWFAWLAFSMFFPAGLAAQEIAPVKVNLGKPVVEDGRHFWRTASFEMDADGDVPVAAVTKLAVLAESTAAALRAHPLPLSAPPDRSIPRISLFADAAAYERAGAVKGTAGFYEGRGGGHVLIRADFFLNAVVVERTSRTPQMDEDLAVHEFVHLGMHRKLSSLPQWFIDGIAEYFASAHGGGGRFSFARMDAAVRDHLRGKLSPRDPAIRLLPVASVVDLDERGWNDLMLGLPPEERYLGYGTALLLTHYYLHGGPARLEEVRGMLERNGRRRNAAEIVRREEIPGIEAALIRFWKNKGLSLRFANAGE